MTGINRVNGHSRFSQDWILRTGGHRFEVRKRFHGSLSGKPFYLEGSLDPGNQVEVTQIPLTK